MKYYNSILELVGRTPLVRINKLFSANNLVLGKLEKQNPLSSVKDRIALYMIEEAERRGDIKPGDVIIEPTSGNTGIGLAFVSAYKGYRVIVVMPNNVSSERIKILRLLGADVVLTPANLGMKGAVKEALRLKEKYSGYMLSQFESDDNPKAHELTTGREIWEDTDGNVDVVVCGIGTGGTITGISRFLKGKKKDVMIVGVEPKECAVITKGKCDNEHKIYGIGAGFIPKILDLSLIDRVIAVSSEDAYHYTKLAIKREGLFVGISSGAVLKAVEILDLELKNKVIVAILPDGGDRYLSVM